LKITHVWYQRSIALGWRGIDGPSALDGSHGGDPCPSRTR
jgi:hypothetical protein